MKRSLLLLLLALPASAAPATEPERLTRLELLESKVYSLEYRSTQLENALTEQSMELAAIRRELATKLKH